MNYSRVFLSDCEQFTWSENSTRVVIPRKLWGLYRSSTEDGFCWECDLNTATRPNERQIAVATWKHP